MIENGLELLDYRCDGMLSDGGDVIDKVYNYILENPLQLINYGVCTSGGSSHNDCVIKLGKDICHETGDVDICDLVSKAEVVNDTANAILNNDFLPEAPSISVPPQVDISSRLTALVEEFKDLDCSAMSEISKQNLVKYLNDLEPRFAAQGRQSEFNNLLKKLSCDVVGEFKCGDKDVKFAAEPICKPKFINVWLKPVAVGSVTGVGVGFAWHKVLKGPVTLSLLAGTIAGAGMTYYIKKKKEKE